MNPQVFLAVSHAGQVAAPDLGDGPYHLNSTDAGLKEKAVPFIAQKEKQVVYHYFSVTLLTLYSIALRCF
jgi:hypothetical protein